MSPKLSPTLLAIIGVLVFIAYILLIGIDVFKLATTIVRARPEYYLLAICLDVCFIFFYALAWFLCVKATYRGVKLRDAVLMVIISWFGDMLIPVAFTTGEVIRLYLLKKLYGIEYSRGLAATVVHRILSALAFVIFVTMGLIFLIEGGAVLPSSVLKQAVFAVSMAFVVVLVGLVVLLRPDLVERVTYRAYWLATRSLARLRLERYRRAIDSAVRSYKESVNAIKGNVLYVCLGFFATITQWAFGVSIPYVIFDAVGYHMSYWALAAAYPLYGLVDNIPVGIPANAGVLDMAMTSMFILLGAPKEVAATVTILTRSIIVLFEAVLTGSITALVAPKLVGPIDVESIKAMVEEHLKAEREGLREVR